MTVVHAAPAIFRPNPQKKNILIRRLARAPWWLLLMALMVILFVLSVNDRHPYPIVWRAVRQGIWTTIWVSIVAYTIAVILGLFIALLRRSNNVVIYQLSTFYVEGVRGIPTLVLVYYMALAAIPQLISLGNDLGEWLTWLRITITLSDSASFDLTFQGIGSRLAAFDTRQFPNTYRAIIGLAISYSAFLSEVFRAGIDSIGRGQRDVAAVDEDASLLGDVEALHQPRQRALARTRTTDDADHLPRRDRQVEFAERVRALGFVADRDLSLIHI